MNKILKNIAKHKRKMLRKIEEQEYGIVKYPPTNSEAFLWYRKHTDLLRTITDMRQFLDDVIG